MISILYTLLFSIFIPIFAHAGKITQMVIGQDATLQKCLFYLQDNNLYRYPLLEETKNFSINLNNSTKMIIYEDKNKPFEHIKQKITCIGKPRHINNEWMMPAVIEKKSLVAYAGLISVL
jgi:hypothetical protein